MPLRFREDRATQAAARLLRLRGGRMSYLKLLKLLYLADRQALVQLGRPITHDLLVSMPRGPVLSNTYNLMLEEQSPAGPPSYWHQFVSAPEDYCVELLREAPNDQLSSAEEAILDKVFERFGTWNRWDLVDYTHGLPEYRDPNGSSIPIDLRAILLAEGMNREEADAVLGSLEAEAAMERIASGP